jgi:hypothetical protein
MSVESTERDTDASRPTNGANSVKSSTAGFSGADDSGENPSPSARATEFFEEYPERARLRLTRRDGRRLRRSLVEEWREEKTIEPADDAHDAETVQVTKFGEPLTWGAAVEDLLSDHARTQNTTLHFKHDDGDEWQKAADNRWMASYQKQYFAQTKAWFREMLGGERPRGETAPTFDEDEARIVLLTRSASSKPDGERLAPTDHDSQLGDSWTACYHTLRNTMRSEGLELGEDWQYVRRQEPHTGKRGSHGTNAGYGHEHIPILVNGDVSAADLRPVVEKHVEATPAAGRVAHDLDIADWDEHAEDVETVECKSPDELEDVAAYVADYCAIEPKGLLERSIEYIAWAAIKHATNTRAFSRSDGASAAAAADRCRQRADHPETDQTHDHGERVRRAADGARHDVECAECGSPHDVTQTTLTAARRDEPAGGTATTAAGGDDDTSLASRWRDADAGASVASPVLDAETRRNVCRERERRPDASVPEIAGRLQLPAEDVRAVLDDDGPEKEEFASPSPPGWRLDAVSVGDEQHPVICDGGGPEMVRVSLPRERLLRETELGADGADRTKWRAVGVGEDDGPAWDVDGAGGVAMYGGEQMAAYLVDVLGVEKPERARKIVEASRGPLA